MRFCHFDEQYNAEQQKRSGSYMRVATNVPVPHKMWPCNCDQSIDNHDLDWYGNEPQRKVWRESVNQRLVAAVCKFLAEGTSKHRRRKKPSKRNTRTKEDAKHIVILDTVFLPVRFGTLRLAVAPPSAPACGRVSRRVSLRNSGPHTKLTIDRLDRRPYPRA